MCGRRVRWVKLEDESTCCSTDRRIFPTQLPKIVLGFENQRRTRLANWRAAEECKRTDGLGKSSVGTTVLES